jgi:hypothetical protein
VWIRPVTHASGQRVVDAVDIGAGLVISRRFGNEVREWLVPALQRRGLVRETYMQTTLRETL